MSPEFLRAVVDTLLPDERAAPPGASGLPRGSAVGIDLAKYSVPARSVLDAIAKAGGGEEGFAKADEATRTAILKSVQGAAPEAFAGLLALVLPDYFEAPAVTEALGWRHEPPQPRGHSVPAMDEATRSWLERVRLGRQRWRGGA